MIKVVKSSESVDVNKKLSDIKQWSDIDEMIRPILRIQFEEWYGINYKKCYSKYYPEENAVDVHIIPELETEDKELNDSGIVFEVTVDKDTTIAEFIPELINILSDDFTYFTISNIYKMTYEQNWK